MNWGEGIVGYSDYVQRVFLLDLRKTNSQCMDESRGPLRHGGTTTVIRLRDDKGDLEAMLGLAVLDTTNIRGRN